MEQLGPGVLLAFALVGLVLIILAVSVVRKLRRTSGPQDQTIATSAPVSQFKTTTSETAAPAPSSAATPTPNPTLHKARADFTASAAPPAPQSQPASPARQPSYTEGAVAAGGPRPSAPACTRKRVDYTNEATEVGTAPSYAAISVANAARAARNMPPLASAVPSSTANDNAPVPTSRNGVGQSYTAVALATVGEFTPKRIAPAAPVRVDYTGTPAELAAGVSYTAIAVAAATRTQ